MELSLGYPLFFQIIPNIPTKVLTCWLQQIPGMTLWELTWIYTEPNATLTVSKKIDSPFIKGTIIVSPVVLQGEPLIKGIIIVIIVSPAV